MTNRCCAALLLAMLLCVCVSGCNQQSTRAGPSAVVATPPPEPIPEDLLLDVGVDIFDPGFDNIDVDDGGTTPGVRRAESEYIAYTLVRTLQETGQWGAVRVIPQQHSETDVYVRGAIVQSDGETLEIQVTVADSSGKTWFTKTYREQVNHLDYDPASRRSAEPFQTVYDRVASDMREYLLRYSFDELRNLRTISALRFAQRFAPDAFDEHMEVDNRGRYTVKRLPAQNDPILQRVERIRQRDRMFVDTLQDFYGSFAAQMKPPYDQWRRESYNEARAEHQLKSQATANKILGALAVGLGILAQASDSRMTRSAGVAGIAGGAYAFKRGLDQSAGARIHTDALRELADSLDAEIAPQRVALSDRTVTLTGTVEEQYQQWRAILRDMYLAETGPAPPAVLAD